MTRALWDKRFEDPRWGNPVVSTHDPKIALIPRMKAWVKQNYPGTKLAVSETNFTLTYPARSITLVAIKPSVTDRAAGGTIPAFSLTAASGRNTLWGSRPISEAVMRRFTVPLSCAALAVGLFLAAPSASTAPSARPRRRRPAVSG